MNKPAPERWRLVEEIFSSATELPASKRKAYLERACAAMPDVRAEVDSLLAANDGAERFLTTSDLAAELRHMALLPSGAKLTHYTIVERAGHGGMGDVYRAHDAQLERDVAIKILPAAFTGDPARLAMFLREARMTSALNHPNIMTVHEIGEEGGARFIAAEFVVGETLRRMLVPGPFPRRGWPASARRRRPGWTRRTGQASCIATSSRKT